MTLLLLTVGTINYNNDINFYEPLKELSSDVVRYNYIERLQEIGRRKMNKEIIETAAKICPDYILFITYQHQISKGTLRRLKEQGFKVLGWFSDDHWRFDSYTKKYAKYMFCSITTDDKAIAKYMGKKLKVIKSQWAANPDYYYPTASDNKYDVTFVGQKYGVRSKVIKDLKKNGISIETFGRGWSEYISFEKIISIFSNSKINLNISASYAHPGIKQIKGRIFEVPMCGGFLLTDYVEGLEDYFEIGKEIVCYHDAEDLIYKVKYYLENDFERNAIARNGYRASVERHTWRHRFVDIFTALDDMADNGKQSVKTSKNSRDRSTGMNV